MAKKNITEKKKVLYFDDEPHISRALAQSLELFDWDVTFVSDVESLFHVLTNHQYDIFIIDIMAPIPEKKMSISFTQKDIDEMDEGRNTGVVIAKKIWLLEKYANVPILFISAKQNPIPDDPYLLNKNCAFLRKPELAKTVSLTLEKLLNK